MHLLSAPATGESTEAIHAGRPLGTGRGAEEQIWASNREDKEHCGNLTPALQGFGLRAGIYLAQPSEGETEGRGWSGGWRGRSEPPAPLPELPAGPEWRP